MRNLPCDALASNLLEAQERWNVHPDFPKAERLVEYVAEHYPSWEWSFEQLLELALNLEFVEIEEERHAYKMTLGLFFNARAQYARECNKDRDAIPFAPR